MTYNDMPVIIPLLATGYLLTIYLLLMLAQRTIKSSRYVADSLTDAYASYITTEPAAKINDFEQWSRSVQRSPTDRWTNPDPSGFASASGVAALKLTPKRGYLFGDRGFRRSRFAKDNDSTERESLGETTNASTGGNNNILPDSSSGMVASAEGGMMSSTINVSAAIPQELE